MANKYKEKRETVSKFDCDCSECGCSIKVGDTIIYDPKDKKATCSNCSKPAKK